MELEKLWEKYSPSLQQFIQSKVASTEDAKDILQDVGLKFHKASHSATTIANPRTWLFQVSRNTIADYYRRQFARSWEAAPNLSADSASCPCDLVEFVITNYLPEKYARPLLMSDIQKLPHKEVSRVLGLSLSATKSRILRARKQLKTMTEKCVDIDYNRHGHFVDYELKQQCHLPEDLMEEIRRLEIKI